MPNIPEGLPPGGGGGGGEDPPIIIGEPYDTICPPGGGSGRRLECRNYRSKINGKYGQSGAIDLTNNKNQRVLMALENTLAYNPVTEQDEFQFPDTLYEIRLPNQTLTYGLKATLFASPPGSEVEGQLALENPTQRLSFTTTSGETMLLSIQESLDFNPYDRPKEDPSNDPFDDPLEELENPPIPAASYYIYDHLGNTRVLYRPEIYCGDDPNPLIPVSYTLQHVVDYYPYGKVLREYRPGEAEKFLTTYHQRDQKTGLDYRGARFYDSDIARFNSLDPLAADYPSLSDYSYVAGNPIIFVDPTGRKVDDYYIFNEDGVYQGKEENDEPDQIIIENSETGNRKSIQFNDVEHDVKLLNASISFWGTDAYSRRLLHFVNDDDINNFMKAADATPSAWGARHFYARSQSNGGKMDFAAKHLIGYVNSKGLRFHWTDFAQSTGGEKRSPFLVMGSEDGTAYNLMDAGNWLWGNAMRRLSFSAEDATYWSLWNDPEDSAADQRAIKAGATYNQTEVQE